MVDAVDAGGRWLYRAGGISALVLGVAYIVTIPLYAHVGAPPSGGEAWLKYVAGRTTEWWAIVGLSVLTDLLFIPVALSLYLALRGVNREAMLVATAFVGLFVVLDLAVTWSNYASLISLGSDYAAATNDAQRAAYVAAADDASAVLTSRLEAVYAIVVLSSGILMIGFVMLKGVFSRSTAYLALVTGILGIVSITGGSVTVIMNCHRRHGLGPVRGLLTLQGRSAVIPRQSLARPGELRAAAPGRRRGRGGGWTSHRPVPTAGPGPARVAAHPA